MMFPTDPSTRRRLLTLAGLAVIVVQATVAVGVYRARVGRPSPEGRSSLVGPTADALVAAADEQLDDALARLRDAGVPGPERIAAYRAGLTSAEALLERAIRTQPSHSDALARLAAVRWELSEHGDDDAARALALIDASATLAPHMPRVRLRLGELLLRMGRPEDALSHYRRAVELDPTVGAQVVEILHENLVPAATIREALPAADSVLAALRDAYLSEDRADEYLALLEAKLTTSDAPAADLIRAYGESALTSDRLDRQLDTLNRLGELSTPAAEAERLEQMARAYAMRGMPGEADALLERAIAVDPRPGLVEYRGDLLGRAGRPDDAIAAYRQALSLAARASSSAGHRARLYRKVGQSEEAAGRPDRAFDAYERALQLSPDQGIARRRLEAMTAAATPD